MLLMNINDPDALGWRLAHAFIGCLDLQGYIVMASQIIDVYHKREIFFSRMDGNDLIQFFP